MKDMKHCKEDNGVETVVGLGKQSGPDYPYGLRITLDSAALKKLGITKLPRVGDTIDLEAQGEVISVSQASHTKGKSDRRVEIQLKKVGIDEMPGTMEDAVSAGLEDAD